MKKVDYSVINMKSCYCYICAANFKGACNAAHTRTVNKVTEILSAFNICYICPSPSKASGTEDAPSSMVSSEAESEASVLSEPTRHDHIDQTNMTQSCDGMLPEHGQVPLDKPQGPVPSDWRSVGNTVSSLVSTRGKFILLDV